MLDTRQHIGKLLHRIRTKFMEYLPKKYKEIGSFDFIDRNENDKDSALSYEVGFRPKDAYGNEDKVAWTSGILTIPKYEGFEEDWKKWCLYNTDPRLNSKLDDSVREAVDIFMKAAQSPENREAFFADKLARRRALRYVKDNLRYFHPMNFEIEIQTRAYNEEYQEFPCWDFVVLRRKQEELLAVSRTSRGVKVGDSALRDVIRELTQQLLKVDVRLVTERFNKKFRKLWKYLSHNITHFPGNIAINSSWDDYNMATENLKVELTLFDPLFSPSEQKILFTCSTLVPLRYARHEIITGEKSDAFRSSVRHLTNQLFGYCKSRGLVRDKVEVKKVDITGGKKGVSLPFHVHEKDLSSHDCSEGKAFIASTTIGQEETKKTFDGYRPYIVPVTVGLKDNDKSHFDKESSMSQSKNQISTSTRSRSETISTTKKSKFQNVRYLNVAKTEAIDIEHLRYQVGLLDAIKEEYSFAVGNYVESYLVLRDLHAKADLGNKVILVYIEINPVKLDHYTVIEVKVLIQARDKETGKEALILKFVAPYAEIHESSLGITSGTSGKVYSNRQKYYVQLEEVLEELYSEMKAGIA